MLQVLPSAAAALGHGRTRLVAAGAAAPASSAAASGASLVQQGAESFLNGTSSVYVEEMFRAWKADPKR